MVFQANKNALLESVAPSLGASIRLTDRVPKKLSSTDMLYRFCGSTDDFCNTGCQVGFGGCGPPKRPSCGGGTSANKRTIGYYESWSSTRKCQSVAPEDLNLNGFTHVNFAFASFDPSTFQIAPMDGTSASLYNRFTGLKNNNRGLQTWISVGDWSFTDPGPTRSAFSTMSGSADNRATFIKGLRNFMDEYGFDGVDIDWEYPQADDRGGQPGDKDNYVTLIKEMRAAFGTKYGITVTLPTSYWYLQHFDLAGIQPNVNWFNLMSYDCECRPSQNLSCLPPGLHIITACLNSSTWSLGCPIQIRRAIYCATHQYHRDRSGIGLAVACWGRFQ